MKISQANPTTSQNQPLGLRSVSSTAPRMSATTPIAIARNAPQEEVRLGLWIVSNMQTRQELLLCGEVYTRGYSSLCGLKRRMFIRHRHRSHYTIRIRARLQTC